MKKTLDSKLAVVTIARSTFDTQYAQEKADAAAKALSNTSINFIGDAKQIFYDANEAMHAVEQFANESIHALLIIQASFTDADATVKMAKQVGNIPIIIWNFRESRTGGRLRLNSFCGVNLAAHALSLHGIRIQQVQGEADDACTIKRLSDLSEAAAIVQQLRSTKILVIGEHPVGFDPCSYNVDTVYQQFGIRIETLSNTEFFQLANAIPDADIEALYADRLSHMSNLKSLSQDPTIKTLKVAKAMQNLVDEKGYASIAVRCWPEFFTDYGAAACGALAIMNENGVPTGCEADVYGIISALTMQYVSSDAVFNTDLVDINTEDDTIVFWHCGQAPIQMRNPAVAAQATLHSNRKMPLLSEFPLKPGAVTFTRFSRGFGQLKLVSGNVDMLDAPLPFSGTAGVAKTRVPASEFMQQMINLGLEHHTALAYGEYLPKMKLIATFLDIEFQQLG